MIHPDLKLSGEHNQALLAAIVASSDDAIISKTLQGVITSWNPSAERLFGYSEREAIGKHISIIIPNDHLQEEDYIINEIRQGNRIEHFETVRVTKQGNRIPISLTISPILGETGEIIGASKIARDITDRITIQKEKELLYRKTKALMKRKDAFVAIATHELKTPVTSLSGFLELLQLQMDVKDPNQALVDRCLKQAHKLVALINDLLDFSRLQAGKHQLHYENFDIVLLTREVLEGFRGHGAHRFHMQATAPVFIEADRLRLEQVLVNLITNGIKYSPGGGRIDVAITDGISEVSVSVRDEGIGIAPEHMDGLFQQFYRAVKPEYKIPGAGIGLYISKEIIVRHGGTINVKSKIGAGSVFTFTIPRRRRENLA